MGLNLTHGCYDGGYIGFLNWRNALAIAAGYRLRSVKLGGYLDVDIPDIDPNLYTDEAKLGVWKDKPEDPLHILFVHSDTEGHLMLEDLPDLAKRMEEISPLVEDRWKEKMKTFINGLKTAIKKQENVEFL